jgi:oligosaccharide repeat unit polymerase
MILLAVVSYRQFQSLLAPSVIFTSYWCLITISPIILRLDYYRSVRGLWLILGFCCVLHIGSLIGHQKVKYQNISRSPVENFRIDHWKWVLIICTIFGLGTMPLILASRGYTLSALLDIDLLLSMAREFSLARYHEEYDPPVSVRLLNIFLYLGAMASGIMLGEGDISSKRKYAFLPFAPLVLQTLILTSRTILLLPVMLCLSSYAAVIMLNRKNISDIFSSKTIKLLLTLSLVISIFIGVQAIRDDASIENASDSIDKSLAGILGSPSIFYQWVDNGGLLIESPAWGAYTFSGLFDWLGGVKRQAGMYDSSLGVGADGSSISNVYTLFRGLIEDFTLLGAGLLILLIGIVAGVSYSNVSAGNTYWLPILSLFYAYTFWSCVVSIFNYNSIIAAWVAYTVMFSPILSFVRCVEANAPDIEDAVTE